MAKKCRLKCQDYVIYDISITQKYIKIYSKNFLNIYLNDDIVLILSYIVC